MRKKPIFIILAILLIALSFITDFGLYLLLAIVMAFITWLLTKTGERKAGEVIVQVGTAMVIAPFILILIIFLIKMQISPSAVDELSKEATDSIINVFAQKLPYIVLSDVAGSLVGSIVGASRRR